MAVGNEATEASVNASLSGNAVQLRDLLTVIANFEIWVAGEGTDGLTNMGYSAAEAQKVLDLSSYMNTIAAVYFGKVAQADAFNFNDALKSLWAAR